MQRKVYVVGFSVVWVSVLWGLVANVASMLGLSFRFTPFFTLFEMFSHPVPPMIRGLLPRILNTLLYWGFAALVVRRLFLLIKSRSLSPPASFTRVPYVLTYISVVCVALLILGLALSIAIKAGSGVPAALLGIPAVFLLPPVVAWVEVRSLGSRRSALS